MRVFACAGIVMVMSSAAFAQDAGAAREKQQQNAATVMLKKQMAEAQARVPLESPVKGAPYSADVTVESTQTLADGNHISRQETGRVYRDGEGRTRREQSGMISSVSAAEAVSTKKVIISIVDPIAGVSYALDTEHKIAWRTPIVAGEMLQNQVMALKKRLEEEQVGERKAEAEGTGRVAIARMRRGPEGGMARAGEEGGAAGPLEHKQIDGIPVEGRTSTKVIPAGAIGNDLPITVTSEEWTSPDLHVLVMTRHNDPRTGETTYRLTNIVRAEPDPSLFVVPADYTVRDTEIRRPEPRR